VKDQGRERVGDLRLEPASEALSMGGRCLYGWYVNVKVKTQTSFHCFFIIIIFLLYSYTTKGRFRLVVGSVRPCVPFLLTFFSTDFVQTKRKNELGSGVGVFSHG
jgi:hypothetical protein